MSRGILSGGFCLGGYCPRTDHYNYVKTKAYVKSLKNVFATMCLRSLQLIWRLGFRNLMLFFKGRDHTIVAAKDSSRLDVEIRNKHNQLAIYIMEKN